MLITDQEKARFWGYIQKTDHCWLWTAGLGFNGYGVYAVPQGQPRRTRYVHRIAYMELVGPIPDDLTIDHLCHVKACCNPAHMEVVTRSENSRRNWQPCLCDCRID